MRKGTNYLCMVFVVGLLIVSMVEIVSAESCRSSLPCNLCSDFTPSRVSVTLEGMRWCGGSTAGEVSDILNGEYTLYQIEDPNISPDACTWQYPLDQFGNVITFTKRSGEDEVVILVDGGSYYDGQTFTGIPEKCDITETLYNTKQDSGGCITYSGTATVTPCAPESPSINIYRRKDSAGNIISEFLLQDYRSDGSLEELPGQINKGIVDGDEKNYTYLSEGDKLSCSYHFDDDNVEIEEVGLEDSEGEIFFNDSDQLTNYLESNGNFEFVLPQKELYKYKDRAFGNEINCYIKYNENGGDDKVISSSITIIPRNIKSNYYFNHLGKPVIFAPSDKWRSALEMIPLFTISNMSKNTDIERNISDLKFCNDVRDTPERCAYPFIFYDSDMPLFDNNFLKRYDKYKKDSPDKTSLPEDVINSAAYYSSLEDFVIDYKPLQAIFMDGNDLLDEDDLRPEYSETRDMLSTWEKSFFSYDNQGQIFDDVYDTYGVVVLVNESDYRGGLLATEIAVPLDAPIIFTDMPNWQDLIEDKLVIAISSKKNNYLDNSETIDLIKEKAFLLKYDSSLKKIVYDEDFSNGDEKTSFESGDIESYEDNLDDFIIHSKQEQFTGPISSMGILFVNSNDTNPEYCDASQSGCGSSLTSAILAISNYWIIQFLDVDKPWTKTSQTVVLRMSCSDSESQCDNAVLKTEEEKVQQLADSISSIRNQILEDVGKYSGWDVVSPRFLLLGSLREIPGVILKIGKSSPCSQKIENRGDISMKEYFKDIVSSDINPVTGMPYYDRVYSDNLASISSYFDRMIFYMEVNCPAVFTEDNIISPQADFLYDMTKYHWMNGFTEGHYIKDIPLGLYTIIFEPDKQEMVKKLLPQMDLASRAFFPTVGNLEYFLRENSHINEDIPKNLFSCTFNNPNRINKTAEQELKDIIWSSGSEPLNKLNYQHNCHQPSCKDPNALFSRIDKTKLPINYVTASIAYYHVIMERIYSGIINSYSALAGYDVLEGNAACSTISSINFDPKLDEIYDSSFSDAIDETKSECLAKAPESGSSKIDEMVSQVSQMLGWYNDVQIEYNAEADKYNKFNKGFGIPSEKYNQVNTGFYKLSREDIIKNAGELSESRLADLNKEIDEWDAHYESARADYNNLTKIRASMNQIYPLTTGAKFLQTVGQAYPKDMASISFEQRQYDEDKFPTYYPSSLNLIKYRNERLRKRAMVRSDPNIVRQALQNQIDSQKQSLKSYIQDAQAVLLCIHSDWPPEGQSDNGKDHYDACTEELGSSGLDSVLRRSPEYVMEKPFVPETQTGMYEGFKAATANVWIWRVQDLIPNYRDSVHMLRTALNDFTINTAVTIVTAGMASTFMSTRTALAVAFTKDVSLAGKATVALRAIISLGPDIANFGYNIYDALEQCDDIYAGSITWIGNHPTVTQINDYSRCKNLIVRAGIVSTLAALPNFIIRTPVDEFMLNPTDAAAFLKTHVDAPVSLRYQALKDASEELNAAKADSIRLGKSTTRLTSARARFDSIVDSLRACFVAGTMITMADGTEKPIESIVVGDEVLSYDFENDKLINSTVKSLLRPIHFDMVNISFGNITNMNTFDHPYWVEGKGWSSYRPEWTMSRYDFDNVSQLEIGDVVLILDKNKNITKSKVTGITENNGEVQTYIFELEND